MTPSDLADLQNRAYREMRPWSAADFTALLTRETTLLLDHKKAFLLAQVIPDEAEILALATDPSSQRQGQGSALLHAFESRVSELGVTRVLLDVADVNEPAIRFYKAHGFTPDGRRPSYYTLRDGRVCDAVLMSKTLTRGQPKLGG